MTLTSAALWGGSSERQTKEGVKAMWTISNWKHETVATEATLDAARASAAALAATDGSAYTISSHHGPGFDFSDAQTVDKTGMWSSWVEIADKGSRAEQDETEDMVRSMHR